MSDRRLRRFESELRHWAERPPALPAGLARRRVEGHLAVAPRRRGWRLALGSAAAVLAVVALALVLRLPPPPAVPSPAAAAVPERLVVHQLKSGTQLYIVLPPSQPPPDRC